MANIRVAIVSYENHPFKVDKDGKYSIGQMIDQHLHNTLVQKKQIQELTLYFDETEQEQLRVYYTGDTIDDLGDFVEDLAKPVATKNK